MRSASDAPAAGHPETSTAGPRTGSGGARRLLVTERECLIPLLRELPEAAFTLPTPCIGWSVRDVLSHCAAALTRVATDDLHDLCPACNNGDVLARAHLSNAEIIDELAAGYLTAGEVIESAAGRLDVIALGEWVHAGDVREALGLQPAYTSVGIDDALFLLRACSSERNTPLVTARLPDRRIELGRLLPGQRNAASLRTDAETLVRLYTGRPVGKRGYELHGAEPASLVIYR